MVSGSGIEFESGFGGSEPAASQAWNSRFRRLASCGAAFAAQSACVPLATVFGVVTFALELHAAHGARVCILHYDAVALAFLFFQPHFLFSRRRYSSSNMSSVCQEKKNVRAVDIRSTIELEFGFIFASLSRAWLTATWHPEHKEKGKNHLRSAEGLFCIHQF